MSRSERSERRNRNRLWLALITSILAAVGAVLVYLGIKKERDKDKGRKIEVR